MDRLTDREKGNVTEEQDIAAEKNHDFGREKNIKTDRIKGKNQAHKII